MKSIDLFTYQYKFKRWLLPLLMIFACLTFSHAQSAEQNYILTRTMTDSTGTAYLDAIQYYDGLGRPVQTVEKGITPSGKDMVTLQEYDSFGRESNLWLPTPYAGNGNFTDPAAINAESKNTYSDNAPYSRPVYEASPLNRVLEQYGPGQNWQTNNRSVKSAFLTNDNSKDTLRCAYYSVTTDNKLKKAGNYDNCQLYVTRTMDEDNHKVYEFKDKLGQVVLTRQVNNGQLHDTYYVYDDFGNRCFVLPPLAADGLTTDKTYNETEDALQKYAYLYRYDERNRCIRKKLPGAEAISMIYDKADHLIFSQDGEQRKRGEWTFSVPDVFNRAVVTGICKGDTTAIKNTIVSGSFVSGNSGFMNTGYQLSNLTLTSTRLLTVNYYDSYTYQNLLADSVKTQLSYTYKEGYAQKYVNTLYPEISAKGMLTGTRIYELSNPDKYKIQAYYYDDRGRVAQTRFTNFWGGYDLVYNQYDFTGNILKTLKAHNTSLISYPVTELYEHAYDHAGRLLTTHYQLRDNPKILLAQNTYDELGRLATKYLHNQTDTIGYEYNIRNWATRIKDGGFDEKIYYNANLPGTATPLYNGNISATSWTYKNVINCYKFNYDSFNRLTYSSMGDNLAYEESLDYDKQGNIIRLFRSDKIGSTIDYLSMNYTGNQLRKVSDESGSQNKPDIKEYNDLSDLTNEFLYDANGNMIADFDREIVSIRYNLLNLPDTIQFKNGNQIINRYAADGSKLRTDYFTLATPVVVPIGNVCKWEFQVDVVNQDTRMFVDNFEYTLWKDPDMDAISLTRIGNSEGYATFGMNPKVSYYYYRKDHLGNNREVWRANDNKTLQRMQYYPSGLPWGECENMGTQPYKYNGKEFIEMHGYDTYDYGWRGLYAATMRFDTMDPMAEKYYSVSPYAYCANNPINLIDPNGQEIRITTRYDKENDKIVYNYSVTGVVYNNSDNKNLDMNALLNGITNQLNSVYTTSSNDYSTFMTSNLRIVSSVDDIKLTDNVFQVVNEEDLGNGNGNRLAKGDKNGLNVDISSKTAEKIISGENNRSVAHEFGHIAGLEHLALPEDVRNIMMQTKRVTEIGGDPSLATRLNYKQIKEMQQNYISGKLNHFSPIRTFLLKKYLVK